MSGGKSLGPEEEKKKKKRVEFKLVKAVASGKQITKKGEDEAKKKIKKGEIPYKE